MVPWQAATQHRPNSPMSEVLNFGLFVRNGLEELKERSRVHDAQVKSFLSHCTLDAVSKGDDKAIRHAHKQRTFPSLSIGVRIPSK